MREAVIRMNQRTNQEAIKSVERSKPQSQPLVYESRTSRINPEATITQPKYDPYISVDEDDDGDDDGDERTSGDASRREMDLTNNRSSQHVQVSDQQLPSAGALASHEGDTDLAAIHAFNQSVPDVQQQAWLGPDTTTCNTNPTLPPNFRFLAKFASIYLSICLSIYA